MAPILYREEIGRVSMNSFINLLQLFMPPGDQCPLFVILCFTYRIETRLEFDAFAFVPSAAAAAVASFFNFRVSVIMAGWMTGCSGSEALERCRDGTDLFVDCRNARL